HGQAAPQESELRVGFAEQLAETARQPIAEREDAEHQAGPLQRTGADHHGENDEQQQSFDGGLVKLARMARERPATGKNHGPGDVTRPSPQLPIDEIGEPAEEMSDRVDGGADVAEREDRDAPAPGEQHDSEDD